jgi:hypothetical protein
MRTIYTITPWVGAGTIQKAYRAGVSSFVPAWAMQIVMNFTCWDPITGLPKPVSDQATSVNATNTQKVVVGLSSCSISEITIPDWMATIMENPPFAPGFDFVENLVSVVDDHYETICLALDQINGPIDRSNPVNQAIDILDQMINGDELQQNLWSYYRDIFTPTLATPETFPYLYNIYGDLTQGVKIDLCNDIVNRINDPIDYDNPVYLADYCYRAILYREILDWGSS